MSRALLVVMMFVALPWAGCLGADPTDDDLSDASNDDGLNTAGPQGRGQLIAFEETNRTEDGAGGVDHHHDYWQGRDRVLIFETRAEMTPLPDDQNRAYATFRPPPGDPEDASQAPMIYEATEYVEFTISDPERHACEPVVTFGGRYYCTDYPVGAPLPDPSGGPDGLILRYKHAATTEWIEAGGIQWDVPVKIQITNPVQTDMPHATSSVWEFQVISPNPHDVTLIFTASAEIVRGEDGIPLWPGHPLFYTPDQPSREVLRLDGVGACDGQGCALVDAGRGDQHHAERLVSYGTRALHVWVNVSDLQTPNPASEPNSWFIYHNNATGRTNITNPFDDVDYGIDKRELYWILPVDDDGMDSPYADGSRWAWGLGASWVAPENPVYQPAIYGGFADWAATYSIVVRASSIPEEAHHLHCLDPDDYCG